METKGRNLQIDFIKGIAIISVILYHIGLMQYGYLGVDVFLVINGFLIEKSLEKAFSEENFSFWNFVIRRVNRLWLLVVILGAVALALGFYTMLPDDYENLCETIVASNMFANNILQAITTRNYWDVVQTFKPLMHTWYLGILLQFYICWPFVMMLLKKAGKNRKKAAFAVLLIFTAISFGLYLFVGDAAQKFYYLPFRFWELGIGGLAAYLPYKLDESEHATQIWSILFYALIFLLIALLGINNKLLPDGTRLVLVVIEAVAAMLLLSNIGKMKLPAICRVFCFMGIASYSFYIWHQFVFAFWKYIVDASMRGWSIVVCLALTAVLGVLSYLTIECKVLRGAQNKLLICTTLLCAVTTALSLNIYFRAGVVRDVPELGVYADNIHRGMHAEYCDRPYALDVDFKEDDRIKVLTIGDSYVRDWVNVLRESDLSDMLDISYIHGTNLSEKHIRRISEADYIFINADRLLADDDKLSYLLENKKDTTILWGIGTKCYGDSNGNIYNRRFRADYYEMTGTYRSVYEEYKRESENLEYYIDFIAPVLKPNGEVRIFTDTNMYISQDCRHLTEAGAKYYAKLLDLKGIFGLK